MKRLVVALAILAVLLPCLLLLPPRWGGFATDWGNHLWLISYFGEYYRAHGQMPAVLNTPQVAGEIVPVFYGTLFYPILGWLSAWVGARAAVCVAALVTLAVQFLLVHRLLRSLGTTPGLSATVACLVSWSTYAITNLYNRSALTEFYAGAWLVCAACHLVLFLRAAAPRAQVAQALGAGLFFTLAAGSHPITGFMGSCLFAVLVVTGLVAIRGDQLGRRCLILGAVGLAVALCLGPWLYATARYSRALLLVTHNKPIVAIAGIDEWWVRLFPLPLDARCLRLDGALVSTPYLDAQLNLPLLVVCAACLAGMLGTLRRAGPARLAVLAVLAAYVGFCVFLSLSSTVQIRYLPKPFNMVQFTYRWVNQINLALFLVLCLALLIRARGFASPVPLRVSGALLCGVLAWAGAGLLVKLEHAYIGKTLSRELAYPPAAELPTTFYGLSAYSTPGFYRALDPDESTTRADLKVGGDRFGTPQPLPVATDRARLVVTSVQAFPWNRVYLDGRPVPPGDVQLATRCMQPDDGGTPKGWILQAVPVPAGEHVIEYRFEPDRTWRLLWLVSRLTLGALALSCLAALAGRLLVAWRGRAGAVGVDSPDGTAYILPARLGERRALRPGEAVAHTAGDSAGGEEAWPQDRI
jgi:hypothetical protein